MEARFKQCAWSCDKDSEGSKSERIQSGAIAEEQPCQQVDAERDAGAYDGRAQVREKGTAPKRMVRTVAVASPIGSQRSAQKNVKARMLTFMPDTTRMWELTEN